MPAQLERIKTCYGDASVKEIFSKILFGKPGATPYEQLLTSNDSEDEGSDGEGSGARTDPVGLTGKQGGKVLACFLLSERDNPDFAKAFEHGVLPWLEKEQHKYNPFPAAKILWKETIKYFPILEAGLARAQRRPPPMPRADRRSVRVSRVFVPFAQRTALP